MAAQRHLRMAAALAIDAAWWGCPMVARACGGRMSRAGGWETSRMSRYWSASYALLDMNAVGIAVEARRAALKAISSPKTHLVEFDITGGWFGSRRDATAIRMGDLRGTHDGGRVITPSI